MINVRAGFIISYRLFVWKVKHTANERDIAVVNHYVAVVSLMINVEHG